MTRYVSPYASPADGDPAVLARGAAVLFGAVFLLVGVLGFVPGATSDVGDLQWAGHDSGAELFGLFQVSVLHNVVHVLFGLAGLAAAARPRFAGLYLLGSGVVYAALAVYGIAVDDSSAANVVPLDTGDNWLHALLAFVLLLAGACVAMALRRDAEDEA